MAAVHGNALEGAGNAVRIAGELHRRGIGKEFALARNRRLDPARHEQSGVTDQGDGKPDGNDPAPIVVPRAKAAMTHRQHAATDHRNHQNAEQHPDHADVEAHVAIENMAELVGDDALQLVAIELLQRTAGDGDGGIGGGVAGGEGVDPRFTLQHVDIGHRHARGQRHLLHHVAQSLPQRIRGVGIDAHTTHFGSDNGAARAQRHGAIEACQQNDAGDNGAGPGQWRRHRPQREAAPRQLPEVAHRRQQHQIDQQHKDDRRHDKGGDQPSGLAAGPFLMFEEVQQSRRLSIRNRSSPSAPRASPHPRSAAVRRAGN